MSKSAVAEKTIEERRLVANIGMWLLNHPLLVETAWDIHTVSLDLDKKQTSVVLTISSINTNLTHSQLKTLSKALTSHLASTGVIGLDHMIKVSAGGDTEGISITKHAVNTVTIAKTI